MNYKLPTIVSHLEVAAGKFVAQFVQSHRYKSKWLPFCSPLSYRNTEINDIWHPKTIRYPFRYILTYYLPGLCYSFIKSIYLLLFNLFGYTEYLPTKERKEQLTIAICPSILCHRENDSINCEYVNGDDALGLAWLILHSQKRQKNNSISRLTILHEYFRQLKTLINVAFRTPLNQSRMNWVICSLMMLEWIISLRWVELLNFYQVISGVCTSEKVDRIYCVHEMHPQSRMVWQLACDISIESIAIQHAVIHRSKLWFFPTEEEVDAGLQLPNKMIVYSSETHNLLLPYFRQKTKFDYGCSNRYAKWKNYVHEHSPRKAEKCILFATSLGNWDNTVVLSAIKRIINSNNFDYKIVLRLHPFAQLTKFQKSWIYHHVSRGRLILSNDSLMKSIRDSEAVIGMNTTVIEEAILLGAVAISLIDRQYLSCISENAYTIDIEDFSWSSYLKIVKSHNIDDYLHRISNVKNKLGLNKKNIHWFSSL